MTAPPSDGPQIAEQRVGDTQAPPDAGQAILRPPRASAALRRRKSDARHRSAGRVPVRAWADAAVLDELRAAWGFKEVGETVSVALRFLLARTRAGLPRIEL